MQEPAPGDSGPEPGFGPGGLPLVAMWPRGLHYLGAAQECLKADPETPEGLEAKWGRPMAADLEIIYFLEALMRYGLYRPKGNARHPVDPGPVIQKLAETA